MSEPIFNSDLTMEQIEKNFEGMDFFAGLMEGLQEAYACEKGNAAPGTISHKRSLPNVDVAAVRAALQMTQKVFAEMLGVSSRTVEAWECGRSNPTPTAKKLIYLIQEDNSLAQKLQLQA